MDPNETLRMLRENARLILECDEFKEDCKCDERAEEMAEGFQELDNWLSRGGFLPHVWGTSGLAARPK